MMIHSLLIAFERGNLRLVVCGFCIAWSLLIAGCQIGSSGQADYAKKPVYHVVLLWLKEPGNDEAREALLDAGRGFKNIPGLLSVDAGRPLSSERAVVDSSYDVGFVMKFRNANALQNYLTSEKHKQAVAATLKPLVEKMIVYDFFAEISRQTRLGEQEALTPAQEALERRLYPYKDTREYLPR